MKFLPNLIFFTILISESYSQLNTNIIQIIVVNYHGTRSPLSSYPTDPYGESYWTRYGGLGQITPRGLLQSYNLGQYIKNFYSSFLTPSYSPQRVYVRSVDSDPALVSTSAFLSGMYPPSNSDQLWSPTVSWFPIPIHSAESVSNPIVLKECPKHHMLVKNSMNTSRHFETELKYMELIKNITGYTASADINFQNLSLIYDNAYSKIASNLPLELWLSDSYQNLQTINNYILNLKYGSIEKARLISGGILLDLLKKVRNKMDGAKNEAQIYSLLDYHMLSLIRLLNLNINITQLHFGASLVFELRKDQNGLHYINLLLRNNNITEPTSLVPVKMVECDQLCNFGNFFDILIKRTANNLTNECTINEPGMEYTKTTDSIFSTNFYTTPCPMYPTNWSINSTINPYNIQDYSQKKPELSRLELALIIVISILGAFTLILSISFGLYIYKNKVSKVAF